MFISAIRCFRRPFEKSFMLLNARIIVHSRKFSVANTLFLHRSLKFSAIAGTSSDESLTHSHRSNIFRPHRKDKRPSDEVTTYI